MLDTEPAQNLQCAVWDAVCGNPEYSERMGQLMAAGLGAELCGKCQMAVSYGVAPFCDPGKLSRLWRR